MNLLRNSLIILGMLFIVHSGFSQEKRDTLKFSVSEAQKYALEYNRTVRSAKMDIEIAKKKVWETTAIGLPQFTAKADYQHLFTIPELSLGGQTVLAVENLQDQDQITAGMIRNEQVHTSFVPMDPVKMGIKDNITYTFTLSQLIFSGEYIVGLQASRAYKALSEKSSARAEQSTKESVTSGYYTVLTLNENIKVLNESFVLVDKTYNEINAMNKEGFVENTEVDQIKINRSNIQTMINSLTNQRDVAIKLLKLQLGIDFSQPVILTDSLHTIICNGNDQYLTSQFDVTSNIDYQLAVTQEQLMSLSLKREKSKFLPTISAFYQHQEYMKEPPINFQPKDVAGASLSIPILTSGSRISKVGQARLELEKARLAKEDASQGLIMQFDQAKADYITAFNNYSTNKESMELSQKIYNKTLIKYREGVSTSLDLTQNQNQFLTSQSNYYNAVLTMLNAQAKLERILSKYEKK